MPTGPGKPVPVLYVYIKNIKNIFNYILYIHTICICSYIRIYVYIHIHIYILLYLYLYTRTDYISVIFRLSRSLAVSFFLPFSLSLSLSLSPPWLPSKCRFSSHLRKVCSCCCLQLLETPQGTQRPLLGLRLGCHSQHRDYSCLSEMSTLIFCFPGPNILLKDTHAASPQTLLGQQSKDFKSRCSSLTAPIWSILIPEFLSRSFQGNRTTFTAS